MMLLLVDGLASQSMTRLWRRLHWRAVGEWFSDDHSALVHEWSDQSQNVLTSKSVDGTKHTSKLLMVAPARPAPAKQKPQPHMHHGIPKSN